MPAPDLPDSRLRPARDRRTFFAWAATAVPRTFGAALPHAALAAAWSLAGRDVAARLALAAARERLVAADRFASAVVLRPSVGEPMVVPLARPGAFELDRPDLDLYRDPALQSPLALLARLAPDLSLEPAALARVADELADAAFNLALALALAELRARARLALARWPAPIDPENLVVAGHPWHPMAKTRLGLHLHDNLRHGPDALARGTVCAVDVAADLAVRAGTFADLALFPAPAPGWVRVPVHALQRRRLPSLLADLWGARVRPAACLPRAGRALLSLRTVALADVHLKLATDMHTTSARRQVSPMSVHNGPRVSALLARIAAADPHVRRGLRVQPEPAAAGLDPAVAGPRAGQLGVLVRPDPAPLARALADEPVPADSPNQPVPADSPSIWVCAALGERWPGDARELGARDLSLRTARPPSLALARDPTLLHRRAGEPLLRTISGAYPSVDAALRRYVDLLVPPALRLLAAHGVALELHLQNTLVVHRRGRLLGFIARDLGGVRVHRGRLRAAGHALDLAPGSFLATDDLLEVQTKLAHTLLHAHLTHVFAWAVDLGADEPALWQHTRTTIHAALAAWSADPRLAPACAADRDVLLAPSARAKALLRMRLDERVTDYAYTTIATPFP